MYDFYTYQKIECDKAKSNSMFNFVINNDGTIYCHNLNNQIFQIKKNEIELFYELKLEETSNDISLVVANDNNLVIGAKKIIVLNKLGAKVTEYNPGEKYLGPGYKAKNKQVLFHISSSDFILSYSNGVFVEQKLQYSKNEWQNRGVLKFFSVKNLMYAIDLKSKLTFKYDPFSFKLISLPQNETFKRSASIRIYETENELWVVGTLLGTAIIKDTLSLLDTTIIYKNYFISDVYQDNEGNMLLSTFDKGVLVISDLKIPDVIDSFRDDPITSIYADEDLDLILGSTKGVLMNYSAGKFTPINKIGKRPIEGIYGDKKSKLIVFDDGCIRAYNKQTKQTINIILSSLKDAVFISNEQFYLGTNGGITKCTLKNNKIQSDWLPNLKARIYCLEYDSLKKVLYAATANGLISINGLGLIKNIKYKSDDVFSKHLYFNSGKLYVSTSKNGVLVIKNDSVVDVIFPSVSGKTQDLDKMIFYNGNIVAKSSNGFFLFNKDGKLLKSLHTIFGFSMHRVIDFTYFKNHLWVSHSGGVQQLDLNYRQGNQSTPIIKLKKVYVNDEITPLSTNNYFSSNQRKIQFVLSSATIRNRETLCYHYKLIGYDTKWNINNYASNQITYNALAPGDYTFLTKVENQGVFSKPISYSFSISKPFYSTWWFIVFGIASFLFLVLMIYRRQLKNQRKKSEQINELNASKLIAIQSQMNPHFIFNALNSIQDLVLKGDVEHSYSYITTFSDLVRRTLNYSEKEFIDFEKEIKLLELYLSLEKLRFKKDLNFELIGNTISDIMIPPLLIQPFIENALIHGLLHKEGEKRLKITFELRDMLICTIEDNGVGREKAKSIKQRQKSEHESFSGKAIHKRFEILSKIHEGQFGYTYLDLQQNNQPSGTVVILKMPIKHKF